MADPLSILGGIGAAAGIIATITKTVKYLNDLQTKYTEAEMSIRQLMRQLMAIKAALLQIQEWTGLNLSRSPRERELVDAFDVAFEGCKEAMDAMAEEVARLAQDALAGDHRLMRARYMWNEENMKDHQGRLDSQVQALQLLLSAVQCRTASEQTALLREPRSRQIVEKVRDDTSSLRASSRRGSVIRSSSILSHGNSTIGGTEFDMDNSIVNTEVYRRAMAHHQRARSADERIRRPHGSSSPNGLHGFNRLPSPDSGFAEWSEASDHLSPIDARFNRRLERPRPYERSVASEPANIPRQLRKPQVNITSASETFLPGLNIQNKSKLHKKRSFLPSLFTGSSTSLLPTSPQDMLRPSNHRRGRRHSDTDVHRSIDLNSSDGQTAPPLVQAAQSGSGIEIEELLDQGERVECRHERTKRTALAIASHCGNDDVVAILLQHGANPNVVDAFSMTPLHLAATRGHYRVVEFLLKEDVNVDAIGPEKKTALRLAADNGHVEVVDLLLSHRAKVNARDGQNLTALHSAARLGDEDMVNLLLNYKSDLEAKDGNFQAAIHHAAEKNRDRVVEILLSKKADIEALGKESMSPLTAACAAGSTEVVRLLLQRKASLKHKGDGAMTALHWASFNGHSDVVDLLLEKKVPVEPRTTDGRTPLHLAVMADNFAVAELLLRKGASAEAQCSDLLRPLHHAVASSDTGIVQLLLGHGANLEAETKLGKRPLHQATVHGNPAIIEMLLQRGAYIDPRDGAGDRPLCLASAEGNVEAIRILLDRGAEMRSRYSKGPSHEDSPLCIAAKHGHLPVVEEFVQRGASVRQRDESNWQPLRYAAYFGHPEVVQYLLACGASISSLDNPGSFGFNLTASRIGFAPHADIDEFRRQSVLMLLHDAEIREQDSNHINNSYPSYASNQSPRQDFPAEKGDDQDSGDGGRFVSQPTFERQELPVLQKSPRERPLPYHSPGNEQKSEAVRKKTPDTTTRPPTPPRPRSPPAPAPAVSQASRFTLDPSSSSRPQWMPVVPPVPPSMPRPLPTEGTISPLPPGLRVGESRSPGIVSPLPSQAGGAVENSNTPPRSPRIPQSPSRPPPPIPSIPRNESNTGTTRSPAAPTRSPPLPPDLPPIPDPSEAIVVCDDCRVGGRTTTDLSCQGCREALFMYHHIMSGESSPTGFHPTDDAGAYKEPSSSQAPIYELA